MLQPNFACHQIFAAEQEILFANYLLQCSDMNYPLKIVTRHHLGYETTIKSNISLLDTWTEEEMAGLEWFCGFITHQEHLVR
jgi:hypothetical protein